MSGRKMEAKAASVVGNGNGPAPADVWVRLGNDPNKHPKVSIPRLTMQLTLSHDFKDREFVVGGAGETLQEQKVKSGEEVEVSHLDTVTLTSGAKGEVRGNPWRIRPIHYYRCLAGHAGEVEDDWWIKATFVTVSFLRKEGWGHGLRWFLDKGRRSTTGKDDAKTKGSGVNGVVDAYLKVKAGQVCAIMGMSGCGKSLFLEVLAGVRKASNGAEVSFFFDEVGSQVMRAHDPVDGVNKIAYVRQEDPLIGDLTLRQSLMFRCRLLWPWMSPSVVKQTVRLAARVVAPKDKESPASHATGKGGNEDWMDKRIGAPLDRDGVMSGGQRRLANIAHELIGHPLALLMDEPTSGLSSSDAKRVVEGLKNHASAYGIPLVMSVHQPPRDVFNEFDVLLLMAKPGRILFHGKKGDACKALFTKVLFAWRKGFFKDEQTRIGNLKDEEACKAIMCLGFRAMEELRYGLAKDSPVDRRLADIECPPEWLTEGMKEWRKGGEATRTSAGLVNVLLAKDALDPRMNFYALNPADVISDFLGLLSEHDAEVLGRNDVREGSGIEELAPPERRPDPTRGASTGELLAANRLGLLRSTDRLVRIWWELVKRVACVLVRDKGGFAFLALQGMILAVMLMVAFRDHGPDRFGALDLFAGTVRMNKKFDENNQGLAEGERKGHDSMVSKKYQATNWTNWTNRVGMTSATGTGELRWVRKPGSEEGARPWHLDGHARHQGTLLFVVAFAVLWMAVVGGAREISQDYPVIIHEGMLGVGPAAVALSRFAVLWALSCWHSIPLVLAGGWLAQERASWLWYADAWLSMVCLGGLATASGLLISAWSRSQRMALVIVPFVTVPQVLFAGVLQSFPSSGHWFNWVAKVLPLRLGWEALLSRGRLWNGGVVQFGWSGVNEGSKDAMETFINSTKVDELGWKRLYFGDAVDAVWPVDARWIMAGCTVGMMVMVWWRLRAKIRRGVEG